ncbi:MAG: hypothetical protein COA83_06260 [Methylophaga sp.]|nr:MAG: hypothetical protein COA83_06260 [Methylophaga sp.]
MDEGNSNKTENYIFLSKVSWVAYLKSFLLTCLFGIILVVVSVVGAEIIGLGTESGAGLFTGLILTLLLIMFNFWYLTSITLYYDNHGVWLFSGVFPWARGYSGVKWRDIDDATYQTGFISWISKSYTIRIGHRFTKSSEIILPHMSHGEKAVARINELHQKYSDTNGITLD